MYLFKLAMRRMKILAAVAVATAGLASSASAQAPTIVEAHSVSYGPGSSAQTVVNGQGSGTFVGQSAASNGGRAETFVQGSGTNGGFVNAQGTSISNGPGLARTTVMGEAQFGANVQVQGTSLANFGHAESFSRGTGIGNAQVFSTATAQSQFGPPAIANSQAFGLGNGGPVMVRAEAMSNAIYVPTQVNVNASGIVQNGGSANVIATGLGHGTGPGPVVVYVNGSAQVMGGGYANTQVTGYSSGR